MKHSILAAATLIAILFSSCVQTPAEVAVTGIELSDNDIELVAGQTHTLTATVLPEDAANKAVEWTSAVPGVATVSNDGVILALEMGATTITATTKDGGYKASCSVIVSKRIKHVESVTLNLPSIVLTEGGSVILGASVLPADADDRSVTWSASPYSVVTVEQDGYNGIVTAVGPGEGTVTVKTNDGGLEATCSVTVEAAVVNVESVTLDKTDLDLFEGETATLVATVLPENATDKTLDWRTTNPDVATVDQEGKVTAVSAGNATITVICGAVEASCAVTVKKVQVEGVSVQPSSYTLTEGETVQLSASVSPAEADQTVEWASSDTMVATVDRSVGLVTSVGAGTCKIFARSKAFTEQQGYCELTVNQDTSLKGIALSSAIMTLQVGESGKLTVTYTPSYAANKKVTWTSSNPSVAVVDQEGTVTAFAEGNTTVTATSEEGGYTANCEVTVSGSAGPMIFHGKYVNGLYYGYINNAPDPRNDIYDGDLYRKKAFFPAAEFYGGSLYTIELWTQKKGTTDYWVCKDRKPVVKLPFDDRFGTIRGFAVRDNWYAVILENGYEYVKLFRGDFSGNADEIVLDSSTASLKMIYGPTLAAFPNGDIHIAARIRDSYFTQYFAVYTIPYNSTVPEEKLIEKNDNAEPQIAVDSSTGDAYILSQKYKCSDGGESQYEVFLYKNGTLMGKVDEVGAYYCGAIAARDGHYYYAVSDYNKQETRVYKDGALQYTIQVKRKIDYSDISPLRVSSSGDIFLVIKEDDAALYKNGSLLYSDTWNDAFNPYCIIE